MERKMDRIEPGMKERKGHEKEFQRNEIDTCCFTIIDIDNCETGTFLARAGPGHFF